jgi:hypothetical protein
VDGRVPWRQFDLQFDSEELGFLITATRHPLLRQLLLFSSNFSYVLLQVLVRFMRVSRLESEFRKLQLKIQNITTNPLTVVKQPLHKKNISRRLPIYFTEAHRVISVFFSPVEKTEKDALDVADQEERIGGRLDFLGAFFEPD